MNPRVEEALSMLQTFLEKWVREWREAPIYGLANMALGVLLYTAYRWL